MCEINPQYKKILKLEFFTSDRNMSYEEFEKIVASHALEMEMEANNDMRIRCHVHEMEPETEGKRILDKLHEIAYMHTLADYALGNEVPPEFAELQKQLNEMVEKYFNEHPEVLERLKEKQREEEENARVTH